MNPVLEALGHPFEWGGQAHSGWLPKGAAPPPSSPLEPDVLDLEILEEPGGYLLAWRGRRTGRAGDRWQDSLDRLLDQAEATFGIDRRQWVAADIRRAVERAFPTRVTAVLESLCASRVDPAEQAAALVLAHGDEPRLRDLLADVKNDRRDRPSRFLDWKTTYGNHAVTPEELPRRYEALGLPAPKLVLAQAEERRKRK